ncbi:uncharacterized protein RCH25_053271 [Pelodytes ibericus]
MKMGWGNSVVRNLETGQGEKTVSHIIPLLGNKNNNNNRNNIKVQFTNDQHSENKLQSNQHRERGGQTQPNQHRARLTQSKLNQNNGKVVQSLSNPHHERPDQSQPNQHVDILVQCSPTQYSESNTADPQIIQSLEKIVQSKSSQRCGRLIQKSNKCCETVIHFQSNEHIEQLIQSQTNEHSERLIQCQSNQSNEDLSNSQSSQDTEKHIQPQTNQQRETLIGDSLDVIFPSEIKSKVLDSYNGNGPDLQNKCTGMSRSSSACHGVKQCQKHNIIRDHLENHVTNGNKKDLFQFWSTKVKTNVPSDGQNVKANSIVNPMANRDIGKTALEKATRSKNTLGNELRNNCNKPGMNRKNRTEMFSLSTFIHIDQYVISMSQQLAFKDYTIQEIVCKITEKAQNDLERIRAIWIWLCYNISYDVEGFLGISPKIFQPQDVLKNKKAVCSGYAGLCKDMCREIGIKCREVSGYSRGTEYSEGLSFQRTKSNHMWNALEVDNEWYLLDACWGAGTVNLQKRIFIPSYDDFFFLTEPTEFIETHWPDDPDWQLLEPPVSFETFEQKIFKTSEFFRLGLFVLSPSVFYLRTERGEVQVSLGCLETMEFSYKIYKLSNNDRSLVEKTHGILTMHESLMTLKVMPPTEGLFELMIFARTMGSKDIYRWVCSYQVDCPHACCSEGLPENPFHFWGLHQKARDFGVSNYNHKGDIIAAESGALDILFKTSRPLLVMYELAHKKMAEAFSKKCLASHVEETQLSCHLRLPYHGYYRLSLFVKDLDGEHYKNAANLLIQCADPINHNELFPSNLSNHCGPGLSSKQNGLTDPSHLSPIINTTSGKCTVTFHTLSAIEVLTVLEKCKGRNILYSLDRYCLVTHLGHKISISLLLPESGFYKLSIFARSQDNQEFSHACDYVVRSMSDNHVLPFPKVYTAWRQGCVLLQPRAGLLEAESWETFRVKIPGAFKVVVIGPLKTELQLTKSKIWEGKVFTGPTGSLIKLAVKLAPNSTTMDIMMSFKSQTNLNILGE